MLEGLEEKEKGPEEPAVEAPASVPTETPAVPGTDQPEPEKNNQAVIKDGVMTVTIYLEKSKSDFACGIGSLDLAKDLIKNYFGRKSMADAAAKARLTNKLIVPGVQN